MKMSDQIEHLATALSKAQAELDSVKKDSKGHGYNYSDLASVIASAKPVLAKHDLSVSQLLEESEVDRVTVTTILMHKSGQYISSAGSLKIPDMRGVNEAQKCGAAISYIKRYMLQSILNLPSEDNDAADAIESKTSQAYKASFKPSLTDSNAPETPVAVEAAKKPSFKRNSTPAPAETIVESVASGDTW